MLVTTKDLRTIDCKFVEFNEDGVTLTLWDNGTETIEHNNIDYITPS